VLDRVPPVSLVLTGVVSVQFGAALATTLFDDLGPAGTSLLRIGFAALIMAAVFRPAVRGLRREDARLVIAFGLTLGVMNLCFYEALDRIPLGATVTLEFIGPLGVAVWGSRRPLDLVWVAFAAIGVVILANPFGAGGLDAVGVGLAFLTGVFWATYIVLSARVGRDWPRASGLAFAMVFGTLLVAPAGIVQGGGALLEPELLGAGIVVAVMCSVIPYSFEMEALRHLPEGLFGVMMSLEPAIAAGAGFLVLGQDLAVLDLVAILFVVVASAGATASVKSWTPSPSATAA
jgi:inner membrane transporter RhtA